MKRLSQNEHLQLYIRLFASDSFTFNVKLSRYLVITLKSEGKTVTFIDDDNLKQNPDLCFSSSSYSSNAILSVLAASSCTFRNAMQHVAPYICPVLLTLRGEVEPGEPPFTLPTVSDNVHLLFTHQGAK